MRLKRHAAGALRRLPLLIIVAGALWLGLWVRVHGALHYPFNADEIVVIQNGVRDMYGTGPDRHLGTNWATLVFGVPLRNSHSLAPLWWWLQAGLRYFSSNNESFVFRVLPVTLGVLGLALFYRVAAPVFGGLVAALLAVLLSTNDIFVYVSSKAQYFDLLPFVLVMLMARPLLKPAAAARDYWIAAVATAAAFATSMVRAQGGKCEGEGRKGEGKLRMVHGETGGYSDRASAVRWAKAGGVIEDFAAAFGQPQK